VKPIPDSAIGLLGPDGLRRVADALTGDGVLPPGAAPVLDAVGELPVGEAAAYLRGVAAGYDARAARVRAELVWTGPAVHDVPVRATAQVLTGLVGEARQELILTTYSAKPYAPLLDALAAAVARGVAVWVVIETLHGAGSAIQGDQPARAFAGLTGVQLWTWAIDRRPEGAKMHAKIAVVDESALLVSSANLTTSGITHNMEAGLVIRGGTAARRAAEHLRALRRDGILVRI
jgi:phosphatidylserine/phosphatidylglycerophosphate/cardiolipin synthase-like enzyme